MDVKCNDITDQRDSLQVLVSEMDDCRNQYEQSLLQINCFKRRTFDSVYHETMIGKLRHYGVTGRALDLLKSYLSNRVQRVDVNGTKPSRSIVYMGVPQGSILGPILVLVYINDLPSLIKDVHEIVLFADDTSLLFKVKRQQPTYDDVNNAISKLMRTICAAKLALAALTSAFHFTPTMRPTVTRRAKADEKV
ncbi:RNA-directed DNA polymerase from mobile element jockey [Eumeta japonica]|uniref:RNA-directed DNA polymerase from mobile element jockey n=1 Tax=Eumeta variegata TaxID=151549 RepID=A0A4C1UDS9_EUMVA|nr:RNA-directed DNA polymerase from mobile element jockey [Eumeta japonica]